MWPSLASSGLRVKWSWHAGLVLPRAALLLARWWRWLLIGPLVVMVASHWSQPQNAGIDFPCLNKKYAKKIDIFLKKYIFPMQRKFRVFQCYRIRLEMFKILNIIFLSIVKFGASSLAERCNCLRRVKATFCPSLTCRGMWGVVRFESKHAPSRVYISYLYTGCSQKGGSVKILSKSLIFWSFPNVLCLFDHSIHSGTPGAYYWKNKLKNYNLKKVKFQGWVNLAIFWNLFFLVFCP